MADSKLTQAPLKVILLIVDPQNDFHEGGSLAVPGALKDAGRIANLIDSKSASISNIVITLDSHHRTHVAHGVSWVNVKGEHPSPFTLISGEDAQNEVWKSTDPSRREIFKQYAKDLEAKGRFKVCIWPEHCLIGTTGHAVVPPVNEAAQKWSYDNSRCIDYVWKGQNVDTEMYSAIAAEIPVESDPATFANTKLLDELNTADVLIVTGEALSHCVKFTAMDIIGHWKGSKSGIILLTDCSSPVPGFQESADEFIKFCQDHGAQVTTSETLIAEWDTRVKPREGSAKDSSQVSLGFFGVFETIWNTVIGR